MEADAGFGHLCRVQGYDPEVRNTIRRLVAPGFLPHCRSFTMLESHSIVKDIPELSLPFTYFQSTCLDGTLSLRLWNMSVEYI